MKKIFFVLLTTLFVAGNLGFAAFAQAPRTIKLQKPDLSGGKPLMTALSERQSRRSFAPQVLSKKVLSELLWAACGINRPARGMITAPSAKNWQEIDVYVAMEPGLYLYNRKNYTLELVVAEDLREYVGYQNFTQEAPVGLIYVADFDRMGPSDEINNFYSATDAGFVSQNVYLYCASEGLATVVLGYVNKPVLRRKMGLKESQKIILSQPVGYPG